MIFTFITFKLLQLKLAHLFKTSDDLQKSIFDELTSQESKAALPSRYNEDRVIGLRLDYHPEQVTDRIGEIVGNAKWINDEVQMKIKGLCDYSDKCLDSRKIVLTFLA